MNQRKDSHLATFANESDGNLDRIVRRALKKKRDDLERDELVRHALIEQMRQKAR